MTQDVRSSWIAYFTNVKNFCSQESDWLTSTGTAADQLQSLEKELLAWQQKLSPICSISTPMIDLSAPPGAGGDSWENTAKYVAITAGFVGTAYVVAQIAGVVRTFRADR